MTMNRAKYLCFGVPLTYLQKKHTHIWSGARAYAYMEKRDFNVLSSSLKLRLMNIRVQVNFKHQLWNANSVYERRKKGNHMTHISHGPRVKWKMSFFCSWKWRKCAKRKRDGERKKNLTFGRHWMQNVTKIEKARCQEWFVYTKHKLPHCFHTNTFTHTHIHTNRTPKHVRIAEKHMIFLHSHIQHKFKHIHAILQNCTNQKVDNNRIRIADSQGAQQKLK